MNRARPESGFTLFEVLVAASILAVILALTYPILATGTDAYGAGTKRTELDRGANKVIDHIADQLSVAGRDTVWPSYDSSYGYSYVIYYQNAGYVDGAVTWGPPQAIYFRYDPKDWNDGKDNDGDGLVDEGEIVWWRYIGSGSEQTTVLARDVREYLEGEIPNGVDDNGNGLIDERGLAISRSGSVWTIRVTLEKPGGGDRSLVRTVESAVSPRNN